MMSRRRSIEAVGLEVVGEAADGRAAIALAAGAVVLTVALQVLAVVAPGLGRILGTAPLSARGWMIALTLGAIPALVGYMKSVRSHRLPSLEEPTVSCTDYFENRWLVSRSRSPALCSQFSLVICNHHRSDES